MLYNNINLKYKWYNKLKIYIKNLIKQLYYQNNIEEKLKNFIKVRKNRKINVYFQIVLNVVEEY